MEDDLGRIIIVLDGKTHRRIETYSQLQRYLVPPAARFPVGIGRMALLARTPDERDEVVRAFLKWGRSVGLVVRTIRR